MKISQSIIKDVINGCCKYFFDLKYNQNVKTEPSKSMFDGLYFESELLGNARYGKIKYPSLKNGNKSKAQQDVDKIVSLAREVFKNSDIIIENVQSVVENDKYIGHVDFMSDKIYDVKFTGETFDRWNKSFQYELHETMDIQARHYQIIEGNKKDVAFLIFSSHEWFRYILYPHDDKALDNHLDRIETVIERINNLDEPTSNMCSNCVFKDICKNRIKKFEIENIQDIKL